MASLINIFVPIEVFLKEAEPLIKAAALYIYTRVSGAVPVIAPLADMPDGKLYKEDICRLDVFITSEPFDESKYKSFYDDGYCMHVIEVKGGRSADKELEKLGLRVVSKSPDKRVKVFIEKLQKYLKQSEKYGMGVGPGNYHSKIFYHRQQVEGKTLWTDFETKAVPVTIPA